jgi:hypothetical protein
MGSRLKRLAPLALLASCGCITGGYYRQQLFAPVTRANLARLEPGKSTLGDALEVLGAPLLVWEWQGDGAALAWGWRDSARWGFSVSVPVGDSSATAFTWDKLAHDLPGAVLFFSADGLLQEAREGKLSEIQAETLQPRPAPPPEEKP